MKHKLKSDSSFEIVDSNDASLFTVNNDGRSSSSKLELTQSVNTINYTGRNPNATAIDSSMTGTVSIGAIGSQTSTLGKQTIATGSQSMAIGNKSWAKGDESLAQGYQCVTLGAGSHAEGQQTVSYGDLSHAEGLNTVAEGKASHTEGENTRTKANYIEVTTGGAPTPDPTPIPSQSDEEKDVGNGWYAHAEGIESLAFAIGSRASGYSAKAYSRFGTANGINVVTGQLVKRKTENTTDYYTVDHDIEAASAFGYYTKAQYSHQFVVGSFNANQNNTVFEVGNGSNESDRRNALAVYTDGHAEVGGSLKVNGTILADEIVESMPGYNFTPTTNIPNVNINYKYVGVAKNGNKITFVIFADVSFLDNITANAYLDTGTFHVPLSVANKLYPTTIGNVEALTIEKSSMCVQYANNVVDVIMNVTKPASTLVKFGFYLTQTMSTDTVGTIRLEKTFLLSDSLV